MPLRPVDVPTGTTSGTELPAAPSAMAARSLLPEGRRLRDLGRAIERWGRAGPRESRRPELPWRATRDPWAVLVSEVMAQQTPVGRVVPAYRRFLADFPTPAGCASAPLGDVLRAWKGLGYNRRAANLHRAAGVMVRDHNGSVPSGLPELLALPGVGAYTARAVLAFAFGRDVGVVDTNAGRVLSRAVAGRPLRAGEAQYLVDAMVPAGQGWGFGQALLDLGALVCVSAAPRCTECPIRRRCRWSAAGHRVPDPARGSAGVSLPQSRFHGSDRQGRGRLLDALRRGPLPPREVAVAAGWPDDAVRARRVAGALVDDGLAERGAGGLLRLPRGQALR
jgi:A/G-specific adenine glycosylase